MTVCVVLKVQKQCFLYRLEHFFIYHREHEFYAAVKISVHPVCAAQIHFFGATVLEVEYSRVFKITVDDARNGDVLTEIFYAGNEHAYSAHIELYFYTCL